jgi:hypothetical protein
MDADDKRRDLNFQVSAALRSPPGGQERSCDRRGQCTNYL